MNKRYFKVDEDTLQNLLYRAWRLDCLESDGVDNWEWYMAGAQEMINEFLESHPDILSTISRKSSNGINYYRFLN